MAPIGERDLGGFGRRLEPNRRELSNASESTGWRIGFSAPESLERLRISEISEIVATNLMQRAFALGPVRPDPPRGQRLRLVVGGEKKDSGPVDVDLDSTLDVARRQREAAGEILEPGDVVVTGARVVVCGRPVWRTEAVMRVRKVVRGAGRPPTAPPPAPGG